MYKLIACDLDETLLNDNHEICNANIEAIAKATKLGVKFVPATGRGFMAIQNILEPLNLLQKENEYTLSFNGAALTENKDNKLIIFNGVNFDLIKQLFSFGTTKDVCIHIYTTDTVYVYNFNEDERNRFHNQKNPYVELFDANIEFLAEQPIAKILYQNTNRDYLESIAKEIKPITDNNISVSYSSNRYLELNKLGVNKGTTMLQLASMLNIKQEETIAVGDNFNDLSMLEVAGLSVAAGNAVDAIKDSCDYVCQNDNNQGVLAELINKFILNEENN